MHLLGRSSDKMNGVRGSRLVHMWEMVQEQNIKALVDLLVLVGLLYQSVHTNLFGHKENKKLFHSMFLPKKNKKQRKQLFHLSTLAT